MYLKSYKSDKCGHMQSIPMRTTYAELTLKRGHTTNFRTIHLREPLSIERLRAHVNFVGALL